MKSQPIGKDSDTGKDWKQEEKGETEDKMAGWVTASVGMSLSKLHEIATEQQQLGAPWSSDAPVSVSTLNTWSLGIYIT